MTKLRENAIGNKITVETQTRNSEVVQTVNGKRIHHKLEFVSFIGTTMNMWLVVQYFTSFIGNENGVFRVIFVSRFIVWLIDIKRSTYVAQYRLDGHQPSSRGIREIHLEGIHGRHRNVELAIVEHIFLTVKVKSSGTQLTAKSQTPVFGQGHLLVGGNHNHVLRIREEKLGNPFKIHLITQQVQGKIGTCANDG